jgi:hypothetical protein
MDATRDEDARVGIESEVAADEFDLVLLVGQARRKPELDALDLLRYRTEDALLETVELVEAAPSANLTQADENASHRLEVEGLVATEDEYETSERDAERFDGFRFACSADGRQSRSASCAPQARRSRTGACRTEGRASQARAQSLCQREIASISERSLHEAIRDAEVFETVREGRAGHADLQLLQDVGLRGVEVEPHVVQPDKVVGGDDLVLLQAPDDIAFVDELGDEVLALAALQCRQISQNRIGENVKTPQDDRESEVEVAAPCQAVFDESRPCDLDGNDDKLRRVLADPREQTRSIECFGRSEEGEEVGVRAREQMRQRGFHLRFDSSEPVVDLGKFGKDDRRLEDDLFALSRSDRFDASLLRVEAQR